MTLNVRAIFLLSQRIEKKLDDSEQIRKDPERRFDRPASRVPRE